MDWPPATQKPHIGVVCSCEQVESEQQRLERQRQELGQELEQLKDEDAVDAHCMSIFQAQYDEAQQEPGRSQEPSIGHRDTFEMTDEHAWE